MSLCPRLRVKILLWSDFLQHAERNRLSIILIHRQVEVNMMVGLSDLIRIIGWRCGCGAGDWTDVCDRGQPVSRYIFIGARVCLCRTFPCAEQTRAVRCVRCARPLRRRLLWQRYEHDSPISGRSLRCACALYLVDGSLSNNRAVLLSFIDHRI